MQKNDPRYAHLVQILREELVPAMGCTEPISIAYGAAKARAVLGPSARARGGHGQRQHHQKRQERGGAQHRRP